MSASAPVSAPALTKGAAPAPSRSATLRSQLFTDKPTAFMVVGWSVLGLLIAAVLAYVLVTFVFSPRVRPSGPSSGGSSSNSSSSSSNDCVYGTWSDWIGCTAGTPAECGAGEAVRMRGIVQEARNGGAQCDEGQMVQSLPCLQLNSTTCANLNCSYTSWSSWTACPSQSCHPDGSCAPQAVSTRARSIVHQAQPGGTPCALAETFEIRDCEESSICPAPVDCVPEPWQDSMWTGCPTNSCVLPGQPSPTVWQYAYRGIATPAQNGGKECTPSDFVQSATCTLPSCTSCTIGQWGEWSSCDVPCTTPARQGVQWRVADTVEEGNYFFCDDTQVTTCTSTGACAPGAFSLTLRNASGCTAPMAPGTDGVSVTAWALPHSSITLGEALALCAGAPSCAAVAFDMGSGSGTSASSAQLFSSVAGCAASASPTGWNVYAWDPASNNCVPPTWPMLDAECLNLCSGVGQLPGRGRVYPFNGFMEDGVTPALSCPITPELLSATGQCIPNSATGAYDAASCPNSSDCVYQEWASAGPWSVCDAPCGVTSGGGMRQRTRNIVAPSAFMGAPCDLNEMVEYALCNSPATFTSITGLAQARSTATTLTVKVTSQSQCAALCAAQPLGSCSSYAFASFDTLLNAQASGQDVFYASWASGPTPRSVTDALLASATAAGWNWRYAGMDEVYVAASTGAVWCTPGFTSGFDSLPVTPGCEPGSAPSPSQAGSVYVSSATVAGGIFVGTKPSAAAAAALHISVSEFAPGSWSMPSMGVQPDQGMCVLFETAHVDDLLREGVCAPAYSTLSVMGDAPCLAPVPCSLSSWTDFTTCPACGPPFYKWQTRDIVAQPLHGGTPCDQFVTKQSVTCSPVPPSCSSLLTETVYGAWPSSQESGATPCLAHTGSAFHQSWDVPVQAAWIAAGAYDALNTFWPSATSSTSVLPQDLADALNSQCLGTHGAPTCVVTNAGKTYSMGGTTSNSEFTYTGWREATCTPDVGFNACVVRTPQCPHLTYSPSLGSCTCPSLCPYDMSLCSFSACGAPCAGASSTQFMERGVVQVGDDFAVQELVWSVPCVGASSLPPCPKPCPYSPDGSMCASLSGHGYCDVATGACVCQPGYETQTCWYGCPVDSNNVMCSGHGTCTEGGACVCDAGFIGFNCSVDTRPILWNYEEAAGVAAYGCTQDWTKCDRCDTMASLPATMAPLLGMYTPAVTSDTSFMTHGTTCGALGFTYSSMRNGFQNANGYNKTLPAPPPQPDYTNLSGTWSGDNGFSMTLTSLGVASYKASINSNNGSLDGLLHLDQMANITLGIEDNTFDIPNNDVVINGGLTANCGRIFIAFPESVGTINFTPPQAFSSCVVPNLFAAPPQVYYATYAPWVPSITLPQAQSIAQSLGGQLASQAQLTSATVAGAQWCAGGWVSDSSTHLYPMQYAVPEDCSFAGKGIPTAGPASGAVIYGPKPAQSAVPKTLSILPWYSKMLPSDPNPTTWNAP